MASYSRITFAERQIIAQQLRKKLSISEIARTLGRSKSTISQEVRRKGMSANGYSPIQAQQDAKFKAGFRIRPRKIYGVLEGLIEYLLLERRCSPEQISGYLSLKYPEIKGLSISPEAIYQWVYRHHHRERICLCLRRKHKARRKRGVLTKRRGGIRNKVSIRERPASVWDREEPGHWEGDLIVGPKSRSAMGTLVERSSRFTILVPLESKDSASVIRGFEQAFANLPEHMCKSLTYDQGSEMALHEEFTNRTGVQVYFADPRSPWQRPSNENTNGLLREFFPKKTRLNEVNASHVRYSQSLLNTRPRKILHFQLPKDIFDWFCEHPDKCFFDYPFKN